MTATQWQNVFRKNDAFQGMTRLLDEAGVAWSVETGGAHPKLVFSVAGRQHKHVLSVSCDHPLTVKRSVADVRRALRTARSKSELEQQEHVMESDRSVPAVVPDIALIATNGDPRARDVDLGDRLGFERPRDIRKILARHRGALEEFGEIVINVGEYRGQATETWFLNEEQALYAAAISEATNAHAVRVMLVRTFVAWRRGHLQPAAVGSEDIAAALDLVLEQLSILSSTGSLTEERMRGLLRELCEWETKIAGRIMQAVFASGGKTVRQLRGPGSEPTSSDELDIDAVYRVCAIADHIPARRRLSGLVRNRLDAYCQDRRIPTGAVISLGQRVRTWPRQAVLAWFSEGGRDFIASHVKAHTVDGQKVIDFAKGEAR